MKAIATDWDERFYTAFAAAYTRGALPQSANLTGLDELFHAAHEHGLKLHRFKRTRDLPRVKAVLGILHAFAPQRLLDVGTGRGVFLWPLLNEFPDLSVTAVEPDPRRAQHLNHVVAGGVTRLNVLRSTFEDAQFPAADFDVACVLEVLEHQQDPLSMASKVMQLARHCVVSSVPSKEDDNPEHIQLFTPASLEKLWRDAGAASVKVTHVLNHMICVARPAN